MQTLTHDRFASAERFIWLSARLLERVRFAHLFRGAPAAPVVHALHGYQNSDGGFGHAIEPDFRGPVSQPLGLEFALRVLEELQHPDSALIDGALNFLQAQRTPDGGVPNVLRNVVEYPRAPWWQPASELTGCLLPTASIAGLLFSAKVSTPWLDGAAAYSWTAIDQLLERAKSAGERLPRLQVAYEARAAIVFLDHAPDRTRADRIATALGRALDAAGLISRNADAPAEASLPLDYAPHPRSVARRWFDEQEVERHLDAMIAAQAEDGGWTVPWLIWTPSTEHEWRGILTLEKLKTLRAYGRLT